MAANAIRLWEGVADGSFFYFVHSYYAQPDAADDGAATTEYGLTFTSAVARDNIFATQFHPEKARPRAWQLYRNFLHWQPEAHALIPFLQPGTFSPLFALKAPMLLIPAIDLKDGQCVRLKQGDMRPIHHFW